jgi:hypothetical protein
MKILIQVSSLSYKTFHYLAKRIKERYPDSEFAIIGSGSEGRGKDFFLKQTDVQYNFFDETSDADVKFKDDINFQIIENFERQSGLFVWKIVSSDRKIGGAFLQNSLGYGSKHQNNKKYILKAVERRIVSVGDIFEKFKPDVFLPAMAMADIDVGIYEGMCKIHNTKYAVVTVSRVKNYCAFSSNTMLNLDKIYTDTRKMIGGNKNPSENASKLYNDLMKEIESPDYFDSKINNQFKVNALFLLKHLIFKPVLLFLEALSFCFKHNDYYALKGSYIRGVHKGLQYLNITSKSFGEKLHESQKYIYFPLHINPEYSTLTQGGMLQDQLVIIELLAKSIPFDWIVYVKEHPATVIYRLRPRDFYKKIESIPNVRMAPTYSNMHKVISNAEMVATITGTSGWEAVLRGRPVIAFSDYIDIFEATGLSLKNTDINKLPARIASEICRIEAIPYKEKSRRIKLLLSAILSNSFWVSHPKVLFYDEIGTNEEYEVCGKELADGLINFLPSMFVKI